MSGGSFQYAFNRVYEFAEELQEKLDKAGDVRDSRYPEEKEPEWSPEVMTRLCELADNARILARHMRAAEWLYSHDYSEEAFLREVNK